MLFEFFLQHCTHSPVGGHDDKCQGYSINCYLCSILNMAVSTMTAMEKLSKDGIEAALTNALFADPLAE